MATIKDFQDLEIWQLARKQVKVFIMAKGSNGEFRSQLIRCRDKQYFETEKFNELYENNILLGRKLQSLISYLNRTEFTGFRYKKDVPK